MDHQGGVISEPSNDWVASQATIHEKRGFLSIKNVLSVQDVEAMHLVAMENFATLLSLLQSKNLLLGIGIKYGYKELVQRHSNRYEMAFRMDNEVFDSASKNPVVLALVKAILGPNPKVINVSVVISIPSAKDQSWHSDGPHLSLTSDLPCHCVNVFIPLVDVDLENGPTSFRPESHYYTRDLTKFYMSAFAKKTLQAVESPCLLKGSILMFDYRVLHRGLGNKSEKPRPVLVVTYSKPWFQDVLNFPKRSVYDSCTEDSEAVCPSENYSGNALL